nr:tetratricopeptide repeat protein [Oculatellaceae cyanobacterium Prado106]
MSKKQNRSEVKLRGFGTEPLLVNLQKAEALMAKRDWLEAREILEALDRQAPNREDVLRMLGGVFYETRDWVNYQLVCRRLYQITPNSPESSLILATAYMGGYRTILAEQTFRQFAERWPDHPQVPDIEKTLAQLAEVNRNVLEQIGLPDESASLEVAILNETAQLEMQAGKSEAARQVTDQLLKIFPTYAPALNNLALMSALDGDLEEAIATTHQVLATHPENPHALANLTRFHYLQGEFETAQQSAQQLMAISSNLVDVWQKQAEICSFSGDDEAVLKLLDHAKAVMDADTDDKPEPGISALLYHLAAVAAYRLGNEDRARQYWQEALKIQPGFGLAIANLRDLQNPLSDRNAAWAFDPSYWISPRASAGVLRLQEAAETNDEAHLGAVTLQYLQDFPEVKLLIPALLDRGDPIARQLALNLAFAAKLPDLDQALKDFAQSQRGTDEMRQQAAQYVSRQGLFPDRQVRLWLNGKWHNLMLLGYEIHGEPQYQHSPQIQKLNEEAVAAIKANHWDTAFKLLKQAIRSEPHSPDLRYNLASVYERQGKINESMVVIDELYQENPEYPFALLAIARRHIKAGELDQAEALLEPLVNRKRFHYSEFNAFCDTRLELYVA